MIQSWLSAWVARDFISHSAVAWFAIGEFWLPCSKEKRCYNWPFRWIYIWICSKGFDQRRGFIFSPRKLNPCFWRGKHDLIYYRKGIPVNTMLLSPTAHSMADARHNAPCLAHWIFPSDYKITFCFAQTRKYSLRRLERVFRCYIVCETKEDYKEGCLMVWANYMSPCSSIVRLYFKGTCDVILVTMATHKVHKSVL